MAHCEVILASLHYRDNHRNDAGKFYGRLLLFDFDFGFTNLD